MDAAKTPVDLHALALPAKDAAALVGISRAQFWKLHAAGKLPQPVYLGAKAPRWRVDELRAWLAAGAPDLLTWQRMQGVRR
jgi:predicted DNA-binding transcriptional regulator AlpA